MIPEEILSEIDEFVEERDHNAQILIARAIRKKIYKLPDLEHDAQAQFLLGYVSFLDPYRKHDSALQETCRAALLRTRTLEPEHGRAWLYWGHLLAEEGDASEVQAAFRRARNLIEPGYLKLKAAEMLLVSKLGSDDVWNCLEEFDDYASIAEGSEPEDVYPSELAASLRTTSNSGNANADAKLAELARRVDRAGNLNCWLSDIVNSTHIMDNPTQE